MYITKRVILLSFLDLLHIRNVKKSFAAALDVLSVLLKGKEIKIPKEENPETETCWLDKIKKIYFSTADEARSFTLWISEEVDYQILQIIIFEAFFEKNNPESQDNSVKFRVSDNADLTGENDYKGGFVYLIILEPATEWFSAVSRKRIKGQFNKLNIGRITINNGKDSRTFYKCVNTGLFYPFKTLAHSAGTQKREA